MTRRRKKERREETSRTEKRIRWLSIYVDQESNENSGSLLRFKLIQRERHTHTHTHRQLFCLCTVEIKRIQISYWYILFALNKMISKRKKTRQKLTSEMQWNHSRLKWHNQQGFNDDVEASSMLIAIYKFELRTRYPRRIWMKTIDDHYFLLWRMCRYIER